MCFVSGILVGVVLFEFVERKVHLFNARLFSCLFLV
jgi:hypothetical protein